MFTEIINIQLQLPQGAEDRLRGRSTWQELPDGTFRNIILVEDIPLFLMNYTPTTRMLLVTPGTGDSFLAITDNRNWLRDMLILAYKISVEEMGSTLPRPIKITLRSKNPLEEVRSFMAPAFKNRGIDLWNKWLCPIELQNGAKGRVLRIGKGKEIQGGIKQ